MKVYIDWYHRKVYTETEYKKQRRTDIDMMEDDEDEFGYYLNNNFRAEDIWQIINNDEAQTQILQDWHETCASIIEDRYETDFIEVELYE